MNSLLVYVIPRIKIFSSRICEKLFEKDFSYIALPLPIEIENLLSEFLSENKSFEEFLKEMLNFLGLSEVYRKRYHYIEPIYNTLKIIKKIKEIKLVCYKSLDTELAEVNYIEKLLALVARVIVSRKIDVEYWKEFLSEVSSSELEADFSVFNKLTLDKAIILVEYCNKSVLKYLKKTGARIIVPKDYIPMPIEVLICVNKLLSEKEIIFLVKEYVKFIEEYLFKCNNIDEAYILWASTRGKEIKNMLFNLMKRANFSLELSSFEGLSSL